MANQLRESDAPLSSTRGELVPSYSDFASVDIKNEVKTNLNALASDGALTADACNTALGLVDSLNDSLLSALAGFVTEGLSLGDWEDFTEQYTEHLFQLMSISSGSRFSNSVLAVNCKKSIRNQNTFTVICSGHRFMVACCYVGMTYLLDSSAAWSVRIAPSAHC